jgi:hypothetical protein
MIYRIKSTRDAFISDVSASSNAGKNPMLRIGKRTDPEDYDIERYRSLIYFDLSEISNKIASVMYTTQGLIQHHLISLFILLFPIHGMKVQI